MAAKRKVSSRPPDFGIVGDQVAAVAREGDRIAVRRSGPAGCSAVAGDRDRGEAPAGHDRVVPEPVVEEDVAVAVAVVLVRVEVLGVALERDVETVGADLGRERLRRSPPVFGSPAVWLTSMLSLSRDVVHEHVRGSWQCRSGRARDRSPGSRRRPVAVAAQDRRVADVAAGLVGDTPSLWLARTASPLLPAWKMSLPPLPSA